MEAGRGRVHSLSRHTVTRTAHERRRWRRGRPRRAPLPTHTAFRLCPPPACAVGRANAAAAAARADWRQRARFSRHPRGLAVGVGVWAAPSGPTARRTNLSGGRAGSSVGCPPGPPTRGGGLEFHCSPPARRCAAWRAARLRRGRACSCRAARPASLQRRSCGGRGGRRYEPPRRGA